MKIAVIGLWHLGTVTSACLAEIGHEVIGLDKDKKIIKSLEKGKLPIYEPGLDNLTQKAVINGKLKYSSEFSKIIGSDIIWITYDTPIDENDIADVNFVETQIKEVVSFITKDAIVLISSQLPVGTTNRLKQYCIEKYENKTIHFAYSPENLRLGRAIDVFINPDRVIVGIDSEESKKVLSDLFQGITENIIWMSIPSAEMTKHAINAFLAISVTFINELSNYCEAVGADAAEVELGLKSEQRIGSKAYLKPGTAFAGGTLARDLKFLISEGENLRVSPALFQAILDSNDRHKNWIKNKLKSISPDLSEITVSILGLTYKPNTNTLRRSLSIELCQWLSDNNVNIKAFDPAITELPDFLKTKVNLCPALNSDLLDCNVLIIATEWPQFLDIDLNQLKLSNSSISIIDANGFLENSRKQILKELNYYRIGKANETKE